MTFSPVLPPPVSSSTPPIETSGVQPPASSASAHELNALKNPSIEVPEGGVQTPPVDKNDMSSLKSLEPTEATAGLTALNSAPTTQGPKRPRHPHLNDNLQEPIRKMFHEDKPPQVTKEQETATKEMLAKLSNRLAPDGSFDLKGLRTRDGKEITAKMLKTAHLKVKITGEDGKFEYKVSGYCNEEAAKCLEVLEDILNKVDKEVNGKQDPNYKPAFNLMANVVRDGGSTPSDLDVLGRGGQIHYKLLGDDIVKLTLDPGEHGENDGLSVQCLNGDGTPKFGDDGAPILQKIPLNVVFEGAEHDGVRAFGDNGRPFLPDWRSSRIFEASQMQVRTEYWTKREVSSNVDDINRVQAENRLWNAAYEYLKLMVNKTVDSGNEATFDIRSPQGNDVNPQKGEVNGKDDLPPPPPPVNPVKTPEPPAPGKIELLLNDLKLPEDIELSAYVINVGTGAPEQSTTSSVQSVVPLNFQLHEFGPIETPNLNIPHIDYSQNSPTIKTNIDTPPVTILPRIQTPSVDTVDSTEQTTSVDAVEDSGQTTDSSFEDILKKFVEAQQKNVVPRGGFDDEEALMEQLIPLMNEPGFEDQKKAVLDKLRDEKWFSTSTGELRSGGALSRNYVEDRLRDIEKTIQRARNVLSEIKSDAYANENTIHNFRADCKGKPGYRYIVDNFILKDLKEDRNGINSKLKNDLGIDWL